MARILLGLSSARSLLKPIHRGHRSKLIPTQTPRNNRSNMASNGAGVGGGGGGGGGGGRDPSSNPVVAKLRQLITQDSSSTSADNWEKCWEEGVTPWDLGQATPVVLHLLQTGTLPKGRVLVPGCGTGYDVVAMASADRYVLGLDISSIAVRKAKEMNDQESGPPHNNSVADYEEVLNLVDFTTVSIVDNELAIAPRRGKEKLARWKRHSHHSSL